MKKIQETTASASKAQAAHVKHLLDEMAVWASRYQPFFNELKTLEKEHDLRAINKLKKELVDRAKVEVGFDLLETLVETRGNSRSVYHQGARLTIKSVSKKPTAQEVLSFLREILPPTTEGEVIFQEVSAFAETTREETTLALSLE